MIKSEEVDTATLAAVALVCSVNFFVVLDLMHFTIIFNDKFTKMAK